MPNEIDTNELNSKKVLDIAKPPTRNIPFQEYPKCIYLHPKDKTKEHLPKVVKNKQEEDEHLQKGYKLEAHIPVSENPFPAGFEPDLTEEEQEAAETATPSRRGGRPRKTAPVPEPTA